MDHKNISWPSDTNFVGQEQLQSLVTLVGSIPDGIGTVYDFQISQNKKYWFASDQGLLRYDSSEPHFELLFPTSDSSDVSGNRLRYMLPDGSAAGM